MLAQIITENGQKKIKPLTADAGAGLPVGSYLYLEKKSNPQGYLYCDGSTFDETKYPLLYDYLGSNVLPDWRELGAKGAEKNTTLIFDSTETDPSTGQAGTQSHDVFTQGEFKDDQLQEHKHYSRLSKQQIYGGGNLFSVLEDTVNIGYVAGVLDGRHGTVTRGKSRAVFVYIKATSGLSENAQDNVINTLNEQRSYSTEEHLTGRKWLDGKPTYEKTFSCGALLNNNTKVIPINITNIAKIVKVEGTTTNDTYTFPLPYVDVNQIKLFASKTSIYIQTYSDRTEYTETYVTLEYTKTTD